MSIRLYAGRNCFRYQPTKLTCPRSAVQLPIYIRSIIIGGGCGEILISYARPTSYGVLVLLQASSFASPTQFAPRLSCCDMMCRRPFPSALLFSFWVLTKKYLLQSAFPVYCLANETFCTGRVQPSHPRLVNERSLLPPRCRVHLTRW